MDDLKLNRRHEDWTGKALDSLVQRVRVFSQDIRMEFGIENCAMLVTEKGRERKDCEISWYRVTRW